MSKPTPGKTHVVQPGETPESIAAKTYGDSFYSATISNSNEEVVEGETIILPEIPQALNTRTLNNTPINKQKDQLTVMIESREINLESFNLVRSIDAGAYGWQGVYPWIPELDNEIDDLLLPYKYPNYQIFIGEELISSGLLYNVGPSLTDTGRVKNLGGFSYTADTIDSTIKPPYEKNNVTLEQRANELLQPVGIAVEIENDISTGGKFDRITANPTDTIFSHLVKLATQRGFLISSNPTGNMVFTKAGGGVSVGTLKEGDGVVTEWQSKFDGRKRFNSYRAIGQSPGENAKPSIAKDDNVPRSRFITFQLNDTTKGDIKNAAEWKRSKQLSESLSLSLPVNTWFAPDGSIWEENTLVTVISKTFSIPNGFTFLIRSVSYDMSADGKTALLTIVPPQVYTGEKLIDPWG